MLVKWLEAAGIHPPSGLYASNWFVCAAGCSVVVPFVFLDIWTRDPKPKPHLADMSRRLFDYTARKEPLSSFALDFPTAHLAFRGPKGQGGKR